ncbi:alpha/beta hydrolase [Dactylosporangium sp. NPDC005572]|uniref:alpha/beta fold hydrolase n=1 Tax=Dactylosporangium sp. NPDC005572 TaxID=3156889 RepID=UPI0033AA1CF5
MKLAYDDHGSGPAVVLLHGGGSGRATWSGFTGSLRYCRIIVPDLRGHGDSPQAADYPLSGHADDVIELLDHLGLDEVALVGHSLGGYTAALVAQRQPARVTRLVLEDPPAPPGSFSRLRLALSGLALRGRAFDPRALRAAVTQLRRPQPEWWAGLGRITAPTLLLSGGPQSHISPARLAEVAAALPDCRLVTIPVGHRIHSLAPAEFSAEVLPFLCPDPVAGSDVPDENRSEGSPP